MSENENSDNDEKEQQEQQGDEQRKRPKGCEHESDRRTARFLVTRIGQAQDQLCDLVNDMRTFEHYREIQYAGWCLRLMQQIKEKYRRFAETGAWPDDDE
jgi:hypothetical protein